MGTHYDGTAREVNALNAWICFRRAAESASSRITRYLQDHQLTSCQYGVLDALLHLGPQCPREIARKLMRSSANITMVVDGLEKRGLVRKSRRGPDRRYVTISLTREGEDLINRLLPDQVQMILGELEGFDDEELRVFSEYCKRLGMPDEHPTG